MAYRLVISSWRPLVASRTPLVAPSRRWLATTADASGGAVRAAAEPSLGSKMVGLFKQEVTGAFVVAGGLAGVTLYVTSVNTKLAALEGRVNTKQSELEGRVNTKMEGVSTKVDGAVALAKAEAKAAALETATNYGVSEGWARAAPIALTRSPASPRSQSSIAGGLASKS